MRYWTVSANPTVIASFHGAGLLQHFFGKINRRQTTVTDPHDNKPKFFAILGGPGSGKSTICSSWAKMDNSVMHIAIGDILRAEAQRPDSPYADVLKANLAKGAIGDPHMTVGLIKQHIIMTLKSAKAPIRTYLLDGFPRAKESAEYFEKNIGPISKLIFLDIPETTMIERCLLRNRADDNETAIRERIHVYRTKSADVIEHYTKAGKAVCVPQPCDSYIRLWMTFFRTTIGPQDLSPPGLLIPEAVLREVTVCGLFISRLGEIRDDLPLSSGWSGVEGSSLSGGGRGSVDVADTKGNR
ncbi:adenylate kinase-domain-containing protein [Sordaria brevicollis]|uniref:Adenylate kinase-domain-containing protein n=1 Tax=Sordaria brevicollis TaxID=83679 RepID=A0AAE0UGC9_SORBR|nr:adenylate kinase-domain-containing protein [Sordaria brevicollis]